MHVEKLRELVDEWRCAASQWPRYGEEHHLYYRLANQLEDELTQIEFEEKQEAIWSRHS
jgi:hypothetical protein